MKSAETRQSSITRLMRDRLGNFSMMTAIIIPVLLGAGGIAIDMTNVIKVKASLQDATDAAALAAASALASQGFTAEEAQLLALQFLQTQMGDKQSVEDENEENDLSSKSLVTITELATAGTGKSYKVVVDANYTVEYNAFTRLFGRESTTLKTTSTAESATESKNALSMFLVLDRSGSMAWVTDEIQSKNKKCQNHTSGNWYNANLEKTKPCYVSKVGALKLAVANLATQLNVADPDGIYVRMGAVAYNDSKFDETPLVWGSQGALDYVNDFPTVPQGGTDSSAAFKTAYEKVVAASEDTEHQKVNKQKPTRYIVFMTDGENTHLNGWPNADASDKETKKWCDKARDDKIEVYTVAFLAPKRGQDLLKYCASTDGHYFGAEDMDSLVTAFKAIGEKASAVVSRLTQ